MKKMFLILLAVTLLGSVAQADFQVVLTPTADVGLAGWDPDAVGNPSESRIRAGWYYGREYTSLVQFPTWTPGPGEALVSAELVMHFEGSEGEDAGPLALTVWAHSLDAAWNENTVTINTIPATRTSLAYGLAWFGYGETANWKSFGDGDATAAVQEWIDTGENFGMLLEGQYIHDGYHTIKMFGSSEAVGFEPRLTITYTPEPLSLVLLGLGALGLGRRRS